MSIFISHGAPDLTIRQTVAFDFMNGWNLDLTPYRAIIVASAHWAGPAFTITAHPAPPTIHDFYGFPDELYKMTYNAPGDSILAKQICQFLNDNNYPSMIDEKRGFDHGLWSPLSIIAPKPSIPVLQISLHYGLNAEYHYQLGQALAQFDDSLLVVGSGSITHNLGLFFKRSPNMQYPQVNIFADWVHDKLTNGDINAILHWQAQAPHAEFNHPTTEHFTPLFVAMGAGKVGANGVGKCLHRSFDMGILAMDNYEF